MIWAILFILALVGCVGYLWVDNQCLKETLRDTQYAWWDDTCELDPVEVFDRVNPRGDECDS